MGILCFHKGHGRAVMVTMIPDQQGALATSFEVRSNDRTDDNEEHGEGLPVEQFLIKRPSPTQKRCVSRAWWSQSASVGHDLMFGMLHAGCDWGSRLSSALRFVGVRRKCAEKKRKKKEKTSLCGLSSCVIQRRFVQKLLRKVRRPMISRINRMTNIYY